MVACRKCKEDVAEDANTCPHCGINNPGILGFIANIIDDVKSWKEHKAEAKLKSNTNTESLPKPLPKPLPKKLVPCRVCEKDVATDAASCPHCGTNKPASTELGAAAKDVGEGLQYMARIAAAILFVILLVKCSAS